MPKLHFGVYMLARNYCDFGSMQAVIATNMTRLTLQGVFTFIDGNNASAVSNARTLVIPVNAAHVNCISSTATSMCGVNAREEAQFANPERKS